MSIGVAGLAMQGLGAIDAFGTASAVEKEGELQAKMEDVAALQRETDRKAELTKAISSQRARASGAGITMEGSPMTVIEESIRQKGIDSQRDKFNTAVSKQSAIYRATAKAGSIRRGAGLSLLKSGASYAQTSKPKEST